MNQIYQIINSIRRVMNLPSMILGTARGMKRDADTVSKMFKPKDKKPTDPK